MTHLLIPIVELTEMIAYYNKLLQEAAKDRTDNGKFNFARYGAKSVILTKLVTDKTKQISLNEKDIKQKAEKAYYEYHNWNEEEQKRDAVIEMAENGEFTYGYKQALKDLL